MAAWLDVNPSKQPDAPVWINIQVRNEIPSRHLSYDWAHEMLRGLARRAGIQKPIRPHLMRHSLAAWIIATCNRRQAYPFAYLRDVLTRLAAHPSHRIAELLPANWRN